SRWSSAVHHLFEPNTASSLAEEMCGPFPPLVHPDDLPVALEHFQRVLRGETLPIFELRVRAKSGVYIHTEFTETPLIKDGQVVGVPGSGRDVTERKRAQPALRGASGTLAA